MQGLARIGDRVEGTCVDHNGGTIHWVGHITEGSADVVTATGGVARLGDRGVNNCPQCGWFWISDVTSQECYVNDIQAARIGDKVETVCPGQGTIIGPESGEVDLFNGD